MWDDVLKRDPCTLEAKELLYQVLEKMGANADLLSSLNTGDDEDLRDMMEEFSRTSPQKEVFKKLLRNWDMCIVEARRNPVTPLAEMNTNDMYKILKRGMKVEHSKLHDAVDLTVESTMEGDRVYASMDFYLKIQEKYLELLIKDADKTQISSFNIHAKHKATPERIKAVVGRHLTRQGYRKSTATQGYTNYWSKV